MYENKVRDSIAFVNRGTRVNIKSSNKSELYERVSEAGKYFDGIPTFAQKIGVHYRTFLGYLNAKRQHNLWPLLPIMLETFPRLSRQWLYFGEGPMIIGNGKSENPISFQEIVASAEIMAAENEGTWGKLLTYIIGVARTEDPQPEIPAVQSRELEELRSRVETLENLLAAKEKIIQLQDELLARKDDRPAVSPKGASARIGGSAVRL